MVDTSSIYRLLRVALVIGLLTFTTPNLLGGDGFQPEEILRKHLNSMGTDETRALAKSRVMEGTVAYRILVGGSGEITGKSVLASEGSKLQLLLKVNANKYRGEKFVRNDDKTFVAGTYDDGTRSEFGQFLRAEDLPLREGLLGGTLSAGWPLLDLKSKGAKLRYQGLKKIDNQQLHAISYLPRKNSDLEISLFFEPETFRHVLTIYTVAIHAGLGGPSPLAGLVQPGIAGGSEVASARQNETRYRIEERFGDFKTTDGLTLPAHYDLRFQLETQGGFTKLVEWDMTTTRLLNNIQLDAKNFEVH